MGLGLNAFVDLAGLGLTAAREVSTGKKSALPDGLVGLVGLGWVDCIQRGKKCLYACAINIWDWVWVVLD